MSDVAHRTAFPPPDKKNDGKRLAKAVERASEEFAAKNLRFTKLRQMVYEEIAATYASIGAYEILARMADKGTRVAPISIYRAIDAWYVKVQDLRAQLVAQNDTVSWVPPAVGAGRFGNWLKDANDWNISRNRFWGSRIPVWINEQDPNDQLCVGSIAELEQLSGVRYEWPALPRR